MGEKGSAANLRGVCLGLLVLGCALLAAPPADAYKLGGERWPGKPARIRYYDATPARCAWSIAAAARAWNRSGAKVEFVEVGRRARADLPISYAKDMEFLGQGGSASLGYASRNWAGMRLYGCRADDLKFSMAAVVAHEFGHVLGLKHVRGTRCSPAMIPELDVRCTLDGPKPWLYRCRFLFRDDIAGAVARYGGRIQVQSREWCDKAPPPLPVRSPSVTALEGDPLKVARVAYTVLAGSRVTDVKVSRREDTCPTSDDDLEARWLSDRDVTPGRSYAFTDKPLLSIWSWKDQRPSGVTCYRFSARDRYGRAVVTTVTVTLPIPPPLAPVTNLRVTSFSATSVQLRFDIGTDPPFDYAYVDVRAVRRLGPCATSPEDPAAVTVAWDSVWEPQVDYWSNDTYTPGTDAPGTWCYSVFLQDALGRTSVPATVSYTYSG